MKEIWDECVPWFHEWFETHQAPIFTSCLVLSARKELGISGRFFNNSLENRHKGQKKKIAEEVGKSRDLKKVITSLEKWVDENYFQEISLALRGLGKYRLAPGYENLAIDPKTWLRLSPESRSLKIKHFVTLDLKPSETYKKPSNAGKKGNAQKRRIDQQEPELFLRRVEASSITPIKVRKTPKSWEVYSSIKLKG